MAGSSYLELLDWRRRVSELFTELRGRPADAATLDWFRAQKDLLFREHPQSPIPPDERRGFGFHGLKYWPFDPQGRVTASFAPWDEEEVAVKVAREPNEVAFTRVGTLSFELHQQQHTLAVFWIEGYAGGLFVPFRDATSGHETYGAGRYLLDTIKSADLGSDASTSMVVLDFNYAYHPSCAYDPRWICPLAPPDSRLSVRIEAGEKLF